MTYEPGFKESAHKEWRKLDAATKGQFKKKLSERLLNPRVEQAKLRGSADWYKIKLRSVGYPLVYEVDDQEVRIVVIAIGRRDKSKVYRKADDR